MIEYPAITNLTPTIVRSITATHVDQEYRLFISLPTSYQSSDQPYPVLYLLDGNGLFSLVKPIVELLQIFQSIPEVIIVGIGYPMDTYMETVTVRGRDLTNIELTDEQKAKDDYPFQETGGAENFFAFIRHELIPFINSEYRTDQTDSTLAGFSLSSTFALYAMLQSPTLFKRVIAISPDAENVVETENEYANNHSSLPVRLSLTLEHLSERYDRWLKQVTSFVQSLEDRKYPDFKVNYHVLEGIDHFQAAPIGFSYGLTDVFQPD